MKTYLYPLLAGLLSLAACTNDTLQEIEPAGPDSPQTGGTPQGTYVVGYSVDGDASTRATGDGKIQISSLDYFLYTEEDGRFVEHRRIAIDPETQQWPLTRDNMTWEQRQFMQDTLSYGLTYRILFVANVDPTLFNYGEYNSDTNPHPEVVVNYRPVETQGEEDTQEPTTTNYGYSDARILLPNVPFRDNNMYCMWNGTLKVEDPETATEAGNDGYTIENNTVKLSNTILLQRIVTRTDIQRTDNPTTIETLVESIYEQLCDTPIEEQVANHINKFCEILEDESTQGTYAGNYLKPYGPEGEGHDYVGELVTYLKEHISTIQANVKNKIIEQYDIIYTNAIQNKYMTRTEWNAVAYVRCNYQESTRIEAMGFDLTPYVGENTTPNIPVNTSQFSIVGFAGSDGSNVINSIDFYSSASPDSLIFTIDEAPLTYNAIQEKNRLYNAICDPVSKIEETKPEIQTKWDGIDIDELFSEDEVWNTLYNTDLTDVWELIYVSFKDAIGRRVFRDHADEGFGDSLENFSFPITIPDIQSEADYRFIPSWNMTIAE